MQACPYDAIYLNEDLNAIEKCHFCAHRVDQGLQPACVTVCPVGAIIPGDFHDASSQVSLIREVRMLSSRRTEQNTGPNVHYIGANAVALRPGSATRPQQYLWSQRRPTRQEPWPEDVGVEPEALEVLNVDHKIEWGWPVALYLLTKGIAAGAALLAPFLHRWGTQDTPWWAPESIALFFTLVTVFLLIEDLAKPWHFYKLFTRPNWRSWLVKGGIVLTVFSILSSGILAIGAWQTYQQKAPVSWVEPLRWANAGVAIFVAGYTAFLFRQCKGRDLWESPSLFWHLLAQSLMAGSALLLMLGCGGNVAAWGLLIGSVAFVLIQFLEPGKEDHTENYQQASGFLHSMRFGGIPVVSLGTYCVPVLCAISAVSVFLRSEKASWSQPWDYLGAASALLFLLYLFLYERAFVRAGQLPPLS